MNRPMNPVLVLVTVALVGIWVASAMLTGPGRDTRPPEPTFAAFLGELDRGELREVLMRTRDNSVRVTPADGGRGPSQTAADWRASRTPVQTRRANRSTRTSGGFRT